MHIDGEFEKPRDKARADYSGKRIAHSDAVARKTDDWEGWGGFYRRRIIEVYRSLIAPGKRVLELGCASGDLLSALEPSFGVGVDFSGEMLRRAKERQPRLTFVEADAHEFVTDDEFDFIILSDVVNDLWDCQEVFERAARIATPATRLVINHYSRLWEVPLIAAQRLGLAKPLLVQNWLTVEDTTNLLRLSGFEVVRRSEELALPVSIPLLSTFFNRFLVRIWPFNKLALTHFTVARPVGPSRALLEEPTVTVVVPARNEEGNIPAIFDRVPEMGSGTELVFVEGGSTDDTYNAVQRGMKRHPERRSKLLRQTGTGKGDAVRLGFASASGGVLMILDADLSVAPEDLPRFYRALREGKGDFINGVRLVYPMEKEAMRLLNLAGNKFFSLVFSWLLAQSIKDTLCGTKVLWKADYESIAANRVFFGDFDPFGDFDLLFGASRLNMKIVDLPIRYRERKYGTTNIDRWRHGWLLLKMALFAARRIKFT